MNVALTALAAMSVRFENEGPGMGVDPDLIKIDARDGRGLLMDYDINLNMKVELTMVRQNALNYTTWTDPSSYSQLHPYCGRPREDVAYYMSLEQSPVGGLKLTHKQWLEMLQGKPIDECIGGAPVSGEVQRKVMGWLLGLHSGLASNDNTKTILQDIIDARFGSREGEVVEESRSTDQWEILPMDTITMADLD